MLLYYYTLSRYWYIVTLYYYTSMIHCYGTVLLSSYIDIFFILLLYYYIVILLSYHYNVISLFDDIKILLYGCTVILLHSAINATTMTFCVFTWFSNACHIMFILIPLFPSHHFHICWYCSRAWHGFQMHVTSCSYWFHFFRRFIFIFVDIVLQLGSLFLIGSYPLAVSSKKEKTVPPGMAIEMKKLVMVILCGQLWKVRLVFCFCPTRLRKCCGKLSIRCGMGGWLQM